MKSYFTLLLVLSLSLFAQGQDKSPKGRIVLEEEEITLSDESGKEVEKRYVSGMGDEKRTIVKQVNEHVREMLGVKSEQEIQDKKIWKEAKVLRDKLMRIQPLKQSRLKFLDMNGEVIKEVQLLNISDRKRIPTHDSYGEVETSSDSRQVAVVSDLGNVAGIISMNSYRAWDTLASSTMTFEYFNLQGEKQWSIQGTWSASNLHETAMFSADGNRVALLLSELPKIPGMMLHPHWAVVYNANGKEIVRFGPYDQLRRLFLTKNGKYGYIDTIDSQICFDVDNNALHVFSDESGISELTGVIQASDSGNCTINKYAGHMDSHGVPQTRVVREFSFKDGQKEKRYGPEKLPDYVDEIFEVVTAPHVARIRVDGKDYGDSPAKVALRRMWVSDDYPPGNGTIDPVTIEAYPTEDGLCVQSGVYGENNGKIPTVVKFDMTKCANAEK